MALQQSALDSAERLAPGMIESFQRAVGEIQKQLRDSATENASFREALRGEVQHAVQEAFDSKTRKRKERDEQPDSVSPEQAACAKNSQTVAKSVDSAVLASEGFGIFFKNTVLLDYGPLQVNLHHGLGLGVDVQFDLAGVAAGLLIGSNLRSKDMSERVSSFNFTEGIISTTTKDVIQVIHQHGKRVANADERVDGDNSDNFQFLCFRVHSPFLEASLNLVQLLDFAALVFQGKQPGSADITLALILVPFFFLPLVLRFHAFNRVR